MWVACNRAGGKSARGCNDSMRGKKGSDLVLELTAYRDKLGMAKCEWHATGKVQEAGGCNNSVNRYKGV